MCAQTTQDADDSASLNGEEKGPDEVRMCNNKLVITLLVHLLLVLQDFSEDEYLADGSESDEEEVSSR